MSDEERQKYCTENETQSVLTKIIKVGCSALQLEDFFTARPDEVCAWTIRATGKYRQQGRNYTVEDGDIIFKKHASMAAHGVPTGNDVTVFCPVVLNTPLSQSTGTLSPDSFAI